jgi:membrane protein
MVVGGIKGMSLREFFKLLYHRFLDHSLPDKAAQLSYYFIFALFPFLFFLVTLTAYLPFGGTLESMLEKVSNLMPTQAYQIIKGQLDALVHRPRPKLLTSGIVVALWSASRGIDAIRSALNLAYEVKESRSFWKVQGIALLITLASAVLVLVAVTLIVLGGKFGFWLAHRVQIGGEYLLIWKWLRWPVTAVIIMLALALTYYLLPDVEQEFKLITPGSVTGALLWLLATWGFTYYAEHFGNYNVAYGSIGGVAILLTWLYISGLIFMLGGEMNALIDRPSSLLSTSGAQRGAA